MNQKAQWRAAEIRSMLILDSATPTPTIEGPETPVDDFVWPFDTDGEPQDGCLITETLSSDRYEVQPS